MDKIVYGFEILDNENKDKGARYMLYTNRNDLLTPVSNEFENGWNETFTFNDTIDILNNNKISELTTYNPRILDTICAHPYEINNDFEYELCEDTGFHRYYHMGISPTKEQEEILKRNNIQLKELDDNEISKLEEKLKFHK